MVLLELITKLPAAPSTTDTAVKSVIVPDCKVGPSNRKPVCVYVLAPILIWAVFAADTGRPYTPAEVKGSTLVT